MDFLMFWNSEVSFFFENHEKIREWKKIWMNIKHLALKDMESGQLQGPHNVSLLKQLGKGNGRNHTQHSFKGHIYWLAAISEALERVSWPWSKGESWGNNYGTRSLFSSLSQVPPWQQQERKTEALIKHKPNETCHYNIARRFVIPCRKGFRFDTDRMCKHIRQETYSTLAHIRRHECLTNARVLLYILNTQSCITMVNLSAQGGNWVTFKCIALN